MTVNLADRPQSVAGIGIIVNTHWQPPFFKGGDQIQLQFSNGSQWTLGLSRRERLAAS